MFLCYPDLLRHRRTQRHSLSFNLQNGRPIVVPRLDFQMSARMDSVFLQKFQQSAVPFIYAAHSIFRARLGFTEQALTLLAALLGTQSRPDHFREGRSLCVRAL